jgi:GTP cyclohydrolase I
VAYEEESYKTELGFTVTGPKDNDVAYDERYEAERLLARVVGLDTSDPQGEDTPRRWIEAMRELTTPKQFTFTVFDAEVDEMVVERDIWFATLCKHHLLPFTGKCHVGYVPNGKIAGLSKIPRLVALVSASLNTQEELTVNIARALEQVLEPHGVAVVMEAQHMCMAIRGARATGVTTRTASMRGVFGDHQRTAKMEFLEAIRG